MILIALLYRTFSLCCIIINEKERGSVGVLDRQLTSKFVLACLARMVCKEDTRGSCTGLQ
jgi:hypothetical protein